MTIASMANSLLNVQSMLQNHAQNISKGSLDVSNIIGMMGDKNQFSALVKVFKTQSNMEKEVLNIVSPNKVDVTV